MPSLSLGTIEVLGLPAAVEAADVACKTADVTLIGYETTDGMGMVAVKIEGQVSAVQAAVAAAAAAAARVTKVFATSVIARPSDQLDPVVMTAETVGLAKPKPAAAPAPKPVAEPEPVAEAAPVVEAAPEPVAEAGETAVPVATIPVEEVLAEDIPAVVEAAEPTPAETVAVPPAEPTPPPVTRRSTPLKSRSTKNH